jgi:hypothetical protein
MNKHINRIVILSLFVSSLCAFGADQNIRHFGAKADGSTIIRSVEIARRRGWKNVTTG